MQAAAEGVPMRDMIELINLTLEPPGGYVLVSGWVRRYCRPIGRKGSHHLYRVKDAPIIAALIEDERARRRRRAAINGSRKTQRTPSEPTPAEGHL